MAFANVGDRIIREIRATWVAYDFKLDKREDWYVAPPHIESLNALLSIAVTEGLGWDTSVLCG